MNADVEPAGMVLWHIFMMCILSMCSGSKCIPARPRSLAPATAILVHPCTSTLSCSCNRDISASLHVTRSRRTGPFLRVKMTGFIACQRHTNRATTHFLTTPHI